MSVEINCNKNALKIDCILQELSRGKEAALEQERERLKNEHSMEVARELSRAEEQWGRRLKEVEEEGRLEKEELELRLASQNPRDDKKLAEYAAEVQRATAKEKEIKAEMIVLQVQIDKSMFNLTSNLKFIVKGTNERWTGLKGKKH